jgi:hypothetical protein
MLEHRTLLQNIVLDIRGQDGTDLDPIHGPGPKEAPLPGLPSRRLQHGHQDEFADLRYLLYDLPPNKNTYFDKVKFP